MEKFQVECDFCGRSITVPGSKRGQKVACECGSFIQVAEHDVEEVPGEGIKPEDQPSDLPQEGWYVHQEGESVGPKSMGDLRDMARRGELEPEQNLYDPQAGRWRAASSVPGLSGEFPPPAVEQEATDRAARWHVRAGEEKYGPYTADRVREMIKKNQLHARSRIWNAELDEWVELRNVEPFSAIWRKEERTPVSAEKEKTKPAAVASDDEMKPEDSKGEKTTARTTRKGLTQNIKGLFGRGADEDPDRSEEGKVAQIPATVLTVEYVDDSEGMVAALEQIGETLEELQTTTQHTQEFTSRLAKAMDKQNRRTNEAIESLRRRLDKLYRQVEQSGVGQPAQVMPPMPEEAASQPQHFGVPEDYAGDDAHQRAWQVAQVMASDLEAYHPQEVREGVMYGNLKQVLEEHIEEARQTYEERTPERIQREIDYFDLALQELVARKKKEMDEEEAS